jgi:hypothetical protein
MAQAVAAAALWAVLRQPVRALVALSLPVACQRLAVPLQPTQAAVAVVVSVTPVVPTPWAVLVVQVLLWFATWVAALAQEAP